MKAFVQRSHHQTFFLALSLSLCIGSVIFLGCAKLDESAKTVMSGISPRHIENQIAKLPNLPASAYHHQDKRPFWTFACAKNEICFGSQLGQIGHDIKWAVKNGFFWYPFFSEDGDSGTKIAKDVATSLTKPFLKKQEAAEETAAP